MDLKEIVSKLRQERDRLTRAIEALRAIANSQTAGASSWGATTAKENAKGDKKYKPDDLIRMFRRAAEFRNEMLGLEFTDNEGAIHSAERILNILGLRLNYPGLPHQNKLREYKKAEWSSKALHAYQKGHLPKIEHVSPIRDFTCRAIDKITNGASDAQLKSFVRKYFKLVLLTPEEALRLNRQNRSRMKPHRLRDAGIKPSRTSGPWYSRYASE